MGSYYETTNIPQIFLQNETQDEMMFAYLPKLVTENECVRIDSPSIYLIKTARNAAHERYKIRRYFAKAKNYFFMLGTDHDGHAFTNKSSLIYERDLFDDMVVADFEDTYNLDDI